MYKLVQRYQDSGWELINGEEYKYEEDAILKAKNCSKNSIAYGMVGVMKDFKFVAIFSEGKQLDAFVGDPKIRKTNIIVEKLKQIEKLIRELKNYVG